MQDLLLKLLTIAGPTALERLMQLLSQKGVTEKSLKKILDEDAAFKKRRDTAVSRGAAAIAKAKHNAG
jgi:hypothetical protein